jgi:hypothetical protein
MSISSIEKQVRNFLNYYIQAAPDAEFEYTYRNSVNGFMKSNYTYLYENLGTKYLIDSYQQTCVLNKDTKHIRRGVLFLIDPDKTYYRKAKGNFIIENFDEETLKEIRYRFRNCIRLENNIIVIPLATFIGEFHANGLIYRVNSNTFEYFEPNGAENFLLSNIPEKTNRLILNLINNLVEYEIIPENPTFYDFETVCPRAGFQALESEQSKRCYKNLSVSGFCVAWTLFYFELMLKFQDYDSKLLIEIAIDYLRRIECGFSKLILSFITKLHDNILQKYKIKELNSEIDENFLKNIILRENERFSLSLAKRPQDILIKRYRSKGKCLNMESREMDDIINYLKVSSDNIIINFIDTTINMKFQVDNGTKFSYNYSVIDFLGKTHVVNDEVICGSRKTFIDSVNLLDPIILGIKKYYKIGKHRYIQLNKEDYDNIRDTNNVFIKLISNVHIFEMNGMKVDIQIYRLDTVYSVDDYLEEI